MDPRLAVKQPKSSEAVDEGECLHQPHIAPCAGGCGRSDRGRISGMEVVRFRITTRDDVGTLGTEQAFEHMMALVAEEPGSVDIVGCVCED